jgi:hypothetical protein
LAQYDSIGIFAAFAVARLGLLVGVRTIKRATD